MKKVLRITRHLPSDEQMAALRRAFGDDVRVITDPVELPRDPGAAEKVIETAWESGGFDEVEIVAPLPVFQSVLELGICPLKAVMESDREGGFKFVYYERIRQIRIVAERIGSDRLRSPWRNQRDL